MKNNPLSKSLLPIIRIFRRFNVTIFIVTLVGGLVIAVFILTNILQVSTAIDGSPGGVSNSQTSFDDATITRLNNLRSSSDTSGGQVLPSGRVNPFSE